MATLTTALQRQEPGELGQRMEQLVRLWMSGIEM
jgi:hypothetical protein